MWPPPAHRVASIPGEHRERGKFVRLDLSSPANAGDPVLPVPEVCSKPIAPGGYWGARSSRAMTRERLRRCALSGVRGVSLSRELFGRAHPGPHHRLEHILDALARVFQRRREMLQRNDL